MKQSDLFILLKSIGFKNLLEFRRYMLSKSKLNEYGAVCHFETRNKLQLSYSNNCKHKFGIGGNIRGSFVDHRFN